MYKLNGTKVSPATVAKALQCSVESLDTMTFPVVVCGSTKNDAEISHNSKTVKVTITKD